MNITFLIGNGFDLSCGLKCNYKNVYDAYANTPSANELISGFKRDIQTWGDFEMELARHIGIFDSESDLLTCLRNFQKFLDKYLKIEQRSFFNKLNSDEKLRRELNKEFTNSIYNFYKYSSNHITKLLNSMLSNNRINYSFISFNYTDILEKFIANCNGAGNFLYHLPKPIQIHGKLNEDIVLGVDNEKQLNPTFFELTDKSLRSLIKPTFNSIYDPERVDEALQAIFRSNIICVFGMSLGDSDLTWRNALLKWVKSNSDNFLFIYDFKLSKYKDINPFEKLDIEDDARDEFIHKHNITLDVNDNFQERIHFPVAHSLFKMSIE